jgi:hypothetical protein
MSDNVSQDEAAGKVPHLWEVKHPYYMSEGSYCQSGQHDTYETFDEFLANWGDLDIDYNRVHRWDWREGADWEIESDESDDIQGRLMVYFIMQRKARTYSCEVAVRRSDEPRVIEFLRPHAANEVAIWAPFLAITAQGEKRHD